ncbi:uncharacterized protein LOC144022342 [Festucalex cinctus]
MRKTFVCDESIIINIPIRNDSEGRGHALPREFHCVFRDTFKVFASNGFPKPLGRYVDVLRVCPSILFVLCGMLTYAAGRVPNMRVTKVSFCLNIISFLWSVVSLCLSVIHLDHLFQEPQLQAGINATVVVLFAVESLIALFLIYWQSKAVCRQHFNTLPIVQMRHEDELAETTKQPDKIN